MEEAQAVKMFEALLDSAAAEGVDRPCTDYVLSQ